MSTVLIEKLDDSIEAVETRYRRYRWLLSIFRSSVPRESRGATGTRGPKESRGIDGLSTVLVKKLDEATEATEATVDIADLSIEKTRGPKGPYRDLEELGATSRPRPKKSRSDRFMKFRDNSELSGRGGLDKIRTNWIRPVAAELPSDI